MKIKNGFIIQTTAAVISIALMLTSLSACNSTDSNKPAPTNDVNDSEQVLDELNNADTIVLNKKLFSWNDEWTVKVDDKQIASINGETFPIWGDTYVMRSMNGNLIASETENIQWAGHGATMYDYNNKQTGHIKDELFSWGYKFHVLDDGNDVAITNQKLFNMTLTFDIENNHGDIMYSVKKSMFSWGAELTITKQTSDTGNVSGLDAVWLTAIINEVSESNASKNSKKNNSSVSASDVSVYNVF